VNSIELPQIDKKRVYHSIGSDDIKEITIQTPNAEAKPSKKPRTHITPAVPAVTAPLKLAVIIHIEKPPLRETKGKSSRMVKQGHDLRGSIIINTNTTWEEFQGLLATACNTLIQLIDLPV